MVKTTGGVPFSGTQEQEKALMDIIAHNRDDKGALIPILHQAQEIYGYLPIEIQELIATSLNIPMEEVYGVATFYSRFSLYPKGKYKVSVCLGTACYVRGSGDVFDTLSRKLGLESGQCTPDGRFSLESCRCVGACGLAPVMMVNEEVYGKVTADDLDTILAKYKE